jgi:hypothetical protein
MKKRELNKLIKRSSEIKAEIENPDSKPDYSQVLITNHIEETGRAAGCGSPTSISFPYWHIGGFVAAVTLIVWGTS